MSTASNAGAGAGAPLISVVIATRNRSEMLRDSLHSVLCQTYRNLEVIVIDDGSDDDTQGAVEYFEDPRLRYVRQEHSGISAARNRGTEHARGSWIAVHDDDDIMLPARLEQQLVHVDDTVDFVYGTFLNFDDESGSLELHHGRNYGYGPALMSGFAPGHSTWLVRADIMRNFPYDEGIESAVDNNVVFRMLRSGVRFRHSGVYCLLRRVHSGRITNTGGAGQKYVAGMNRAFIHRGVSEGERGTLVRDARRDWGPLDKTNWQTRFLSFLPDHLVKRSGYIAARTELHSDGGGDGASRVVELEVARVDGMTWWEFFEACSRNADLGSVIARLREPEEVEALIAEADISPTLDAPDTTSEALSVLFDLMADETSDELSAEYFAVAASASEAWTEEQRALTRAQCETRPGAERTTFGIIPLRSLSAATALRETAFRDASSFRIFSTNSPAEIAATLHASS